MSSHHDHAHPTVSAQPMSRRTLLKALAASSVAVGLGAVAAPAASAASAFGAKTALPTVSAGKRLVPINRIGIQLFTIRQQISSRGFRAVFEELADIGYSEIEFAGYTQGSVGAITPQEIRQLLDDNGLRAVGSHVNLNATNIDQQLEIADTLGLPHLGQGGAIASGLTSTAWTTAAQNWNAMGEKAKAAGIKLYAHNHSGEFAITSDTNERIYDLLWREFNPETVFFQMDIYWAHVGRHLYPGFEPIDYITRDPRRFPLVHLKDGKLNPNNSNGYDIIEFGAGDIDYTAFLSQLRDRGQRYGLYEQDNASGTAVPPNPINSMGNAERSYDAIAALRG